MTDTLLVGGDVVVDGEIRRVDLRMVDGRVSDIGTLSPPSGQEVIDCSGHLVSPGFIDLQCNGAVGSDLTSNPSAITEVSRYLPRTGVTAWLPTVVTSPAHSRETAIAAQLAVADEPGMARPLGLHFEGPLLNPDHAGAHDPTLLARPDDGEIRRWCESGAVRMVTLAPELPGALDVARVLSERGVLVAAGHTAMTPADLAMAVEAGVRYATHLYNAMSPLHHRAPGAVGAVLASDDLVAGLICDGLHIDRTAVRVARNTLGPGRISLVSDASPALGSPYGTLRLGRQVVTHTEDGVRLEDGTLAGSAVGVDSAVRTYREMTGCSTTEAIAAATSTPARLLGLRARGHLAVGAVGDITVLDSDLQVIRTIIDGQVAWPMS